MEPVKVATILWNSRKMGKSARLHREVKVWSPYCGRKCEASYWLKKCGAMKSGNKIMEVKKVRKRVRLHKEVNV